MDANTQYIGEISIQQKQVQYKRTTSIPTWQKNNKVRGIKPSTLTDKGIEAHVFPKLSENLFISLTILADNGNNHPWQKSIDIQRYRIEVMKGYHKRSTSSSSSSSSSSSYYYSSGPVSVKL